MFNNKAFTLVELLVAVALVIILSVMSAVIYRTYIKRSIAMEGRALLHDVYAAEQVYRTRNGRYLNIGSSGSLQKNNSDIGVDFRGNKYFNQFYVTSGSTLNGPFTVITNAYDGYTMNITGFLAGTEPKLVDNYR